MARTNRSDLDDMDWATSTSVSDAASRLSALTNNTHATTPNASTMDMSEQDTETSTNGRVSPQPSVYSLTSSLRDQSFRQVHGRSLNAHSDVYSLPADEEETKRLYRQHRMFYFLSRDSNYYGLSQTVEEVLAPTNQRQRTALDLGCGPGAWTIQCAADFPHVDVLGVDLAPTIPIAPPPNCRFEIDDLNLGLDHFFGDTFDFVHARLLNSGVKDYKGIVDQISRCVRPGGMVMFVESDFRCWSEDKRLLITPNFYTPLPSQDRPSLGANTGPGGSNSNGSTGRGQPLTRQVDWAIPAWFTTMIKCVRAKGGHVDAASLLKTWVSDNPLYERIETRDLWAPLGAWIPTVKDDWTTHPNFRICGEMCKELVTKLFAGARPLLFGWLSQQEVAELEENAIRELNAATHPMYMRIQVVAARKKEVNA